MLIAVDFDGTIVEHRFPAIGKEIPFATDTLRRLINEHHRLVLWTVRSGKLLDEALEWCRERGVEFYAVNANNPDEEYDGTQARKIKVDLVIDDRNIGGLPDWGEIYELIHRKITYKQYLLEMLNREPVKPRKKHWWQ
jgi:hypothetical protein